MNMVAHASFNLVAIIAILGNNGALFDCTAAPPVTNDTAPPVTSAVASGRSRRTS